MKYTRKALVAMFFVAGCFISLNTIAQGGPGMGPPPSGGQQQAKAPKNPEEIINEEVAWMTKKLKLSNEQVARVTRVSEKYAYTQAELMPKRDNRPSNGTRPEQQNNRQAPGGMEEMKVKLAQLSADKDAEMQGALTSKQYKKYLKNREVLTKQLESNTSGARPPMGGGQPGGRPNFR